MQQTDFESRLLAAFRRMSESDRQMIVSLVEKRAGPYQAEVKPVLRLISSGGLLARDDGLFSNFG
jgi:hypothetical protein